MFQPRCLFGNGFRDGRVRMAVNVHPPRRNRIQNLASVLGFEKHAFPAADGKRRRVHAFLCEWVPKMKIGRAHNLMESLMIEILFKGVKERDAINFLENGNVANDAHTAIMLDGAEILDVLVAD
jgi:hypothetical protein